MMELDNQKHLGTYGEKLVQKRLWQRNYRVRDVSKDNLINGRNDAHYDLLVNNHYRLEVKTISEDRKLWNAGRGAYFHLRWDEFDILAIVIISQLHEKVFYIDKAGILRAKKTQNTNKHAIYIQPELLKKYFATRPEVVIPRQKNIKKLRNGRRKQKRGLKTIVV